MKGAGNPSPVWEKGRDEGLPQPYKAPSSRFALTTGGGGGAPTPPPRPVFSALLRGDRRLLLEGRHNVLDEELE
jgi:hypothetical protein